LDPPLQADKDSTGNSYFARPLLRLQILPFIYNGQGRFRLLRATVSRMPLIIILIVLIFLFGGGYYMGPGLGYYGGGGLSIILALIVIYLLFGRGRGRL
jgi:hypothetical protein